MTWRSSGLAAGETLADGRLQEEAERAALEQLRRNVARSVLGTVGVVVLLGDEELTDRLVLEEKPAFGVQKEVVLQALRDQDVPRLLLDCRGRRIGCRQFTPPVNESRVSA